MPLTVAQLVARLTADTSGFYRGMAIANSAMLRSGGIITRVSAGAGLAVLGMGILSLRAAGNFQQSMNIVEAVSGATTSQMDALGKEAIALGADFKLPNVSAKDAADSMAELAKGGLSVNQVLSATRGTLQLGLAANIGFADSATIVARALSAFSLKGTQATTVADLFTAAANRSTADMSDIALGFQMASAQFAGADQTIQALTTSLGLMANAGVVGSDAGTSLKTMINRLTAPTAKSAALMKDLGIEVYNAAGNVKAMPNIIQEFTSAMDGMTKKQKNAALYTIFGSDAIRAARIQMNAGKEGWLAFEKSITKGGEAQKFAEARTKGFNGALQAFGSAVETLAIQLGTHLLPSAEAVVRAMSNFVASIDADKIAAFFGAIASGVGAIHSLISGSDVLTSTVGALAAGILAYAATVKIIAMVTRAWTVAQLLLDAALVANPIGLVVAALAALAVGLIIAYQRSETFRNIVNGVFEFLKGAVLTVVNFVRDHWMLLLGIFTGGLLPIVALIIMNWNKIKSVTMAIWGAISGFFKKWWPLLLVMFTAGLALLPLLVAKHWNTIKHITVAVWSAIKAFIAGAVNAIWGAIKAVFGPIVAFVASIWNAVHDRIVDPIQRAISGVKSKLSAILSAIRGMVGQFISAAVALGQGIVQGIVSGIYSIGSAITDALVGLAKSALNAALDFIKPGSPSKLFASEVGLPIALGIAEGIKQGGKAIPRSITHELNAAVEGIIGAPPAQPRVLGLTPSPVAASQVIQPQLNFYIQGMVDQGNILTIVRRAADEYFDRN